MYANFRNIEGEVLSEPKKFYFSFMIINLTTRKIIRITDYVQCLKIYVWQLLIFFLPRDHGPNSSWQVAFHLFPSTFSLSRGWHDAGFRSLFRTEEFMNLATENVVMKLPLIFSSLLKCLRRSLSSPLSWSDPHPVVDQWGIYKC